jgi:DNA-binding PadR family transcriptional regulator
MDMFGRNRGRGRGGHHHSGYRVVGGRPEELREEYSGRGRERLLEQGDLKLVVLHLMQERPRHGYEIIKAIEELAGGDYSPSPGVIYPTLTLLEELGQATVVQEEGGKKRFGLTAEGATFLESQREVLERVLSRLDSAGSIAAARRAPELQRSMQNLKTALHFRLSRGALKPEALRKIAQAMDTAAVEIERS